MSAPIVATRVGPASGNWTGEAVLWRLSEEIATDEGIATKYVVSSATVAMFSGPETYIFPADEHGNVLNWLDLDGSYKGGLDHEEAIRRAGWQVAK